MKTHQAKDFLETAEGLVFAVVAEGQELGRIRCWLRYRNQNGVWEKLSSEQANHYLQQCYPEYLFYAPSMEAKVHGVRPDQLVRHFRPQERLQQYLGQPATDAVQDDLQALCGLLQTQALPLSAFGVTGSLLLGAQGASSDIDLVCYQRDVFHQTRHCIQAMIAENQLQGLEAGDWLESYQRRGCDFPLDEYVWHEQRKYNKGLIRQRKFDLSLVTPGQKPITPCLRKSGMTSIQATITDDVFGFDYPARWSIDATDIQEVICFTATYTGQVYRGEQVVVTGQLEEDVTGRRRIVVGSDREAVGEFIRVLR